MPGPPGFSALRTSLLYEYSILICHRPGHAFVCTGNEKKIEGRSSATEMTSEICFVLRSLVCRVSMGFLRHSLIVNGSPLLPPCKAEIGGVFSRWRLSSCDQACHFTRPPAAAALASRSRPSASVKAFAWSCIFGTLELSLVNCLPKPPASASQPDFLLFFVFFFHFYLLFLFFFRTVWKGIFKPLHTSFSFPFPFLVPPPNLCTLTPGQARPHEQETHLKK